MQVRVLIFVFLMSAGFSGLAPSAYAQAQDRCRDVLSAKTYSFGTLRDEVVRYYLGFKDEASYRKAVSNSDGGGELGIAKIGLVVKGNGGSSQSSEQTQTLASFTEDLFGHLIESAYGTSNKEVVAAWQDCINEQQGLTLTIEPRSPTVALLTLQYAAVGNDFSVRLEQFSLPGATWPEDTPCLRRGFELKAGRANACQVFLTLKDFRTALPATFTVRGARNSRYTAGFYLPPRMKLYTSPPELVTAFTTNGQAVGSQVTDTIPPHSGMVEIRADLTPEEIANGWRFLPVQALDDIKVGHTLIAGDGTGFGCDREAVNTTTGVKLILKWENKANTARCTWHYSVRKQQYYLGPRF